MKINYFFETSKESIKTYYQMKNKQGLSFNEEEKLFFINNVVRQIKENIDLTAYDILLIPETKNECFQEIINQLDKTTVVFNKNSKDKILKKLEYQKMMKAERQKLVTSIMKMKNDDIKIGLIAANQRVRVANILFSIGEDIKDKKILFMDDSVFTGSTLKAISQLINFKQACVLFSNEI